MVAERPAARLEALRRYGENLGIAFQLIDDVLDYSAREVVLGKSLGDDFRDGKITLPVVLAFERGSAEERRFWRRTLEQGEQREGDFAHAIELLERHGALADSLARAAEFSAAARRALERFPPTLARAGDARSGRLLHRARLLSGKMPRAAQQPAARQPIARHRGAAI